MARPIEAKDAVELGRAVGARLVPVATPLQRCLDDPDGPDCVAALAELDNPFGIEEDPGSYHTTGWHGAFETTPSPYAVAVERASEIGAALRWARDRGVRVAVKGTGHDYLGRSSAAGSLLVWTHHMRTVTVHDAFVPDGAPPSAGGVPAVTCGAGTRWLEAYHALAPHRRYVQGGGCTSVGAAGGFTQGGGFGSFSKRYGTAAGNVLQMEVVTADGDVVVANEHRHPDLFWALRGGGGGTFGVVSAVTLRTHPRPETLSAAAGTVRASSDADYRLLLGAVVRLFPDLDDDHWGEQIRFRPDNALELSMAAVGLDDDRAAAPWQPLLDWIGRRPEAYASDAFVVTVDFDRFWDASLWDELAPEMICRDRRPGGSERNFWWATNQGEVSQHLDAYQSRWMPIGLFEQSPDVVADALFAASRSWPCSLHANKGLSGAGPDTVARERATSVNPAVLDAGGLLIAASGQQRCFPGITGHGPDPGAAAIRARRVGEAMGHVRRITPGAGSYLNETDYFEPDWQRSFWGPNYARLLEVKARYDPTDVFRVHHGVGSEELDRQ